MLDAVTDDLLERIGPAPRRWAACCSAACGELSGLDELRERLGAQPREELLSRFQLGDILADVRRELDEVVAPSSTASERRMASRQRAAPPERRCASARQRRPDSSNCRADVGGRSARWRTTTSWSRTRASASTSSSTVSAGRFSTRTSPACPTRSRASARTTWPRNRDMVRELNGLLQERLDGRRAGR